MPAPEVVGRLSGEPPPSLPCGSSATSRVMMACPVEAAKPSGARYFCTLGNSRIGRVAEPSKTLAGSHKHGAATLPMFVTRVCVARGGVKEMHTRKRKPAARKSKASGGSECRSAASCHCESA